MQLNDKEREIVLAKFGELAPDAICPICESGELHVMDTIFELREYQGGQLKLGGRTSIIPVIPASCPECGHIQLFSAVRLGVVEVEKSEEVSEQEPVPEEDS